MNSFASTLIRKTFIMSNEDSTVERMDEDGAGNVVQGLPIDDDIVDLDASGLLAMDAPGGSRSPSTQAVPEASLPHDATGQLELEVEGIGSEVEELIETVLDPFLRQQQDPETNRRTDMMKNRNTKKRTR